MPGAPLEPDLRKVVHDARVPPPIAGKKVLLAMMGIGLTIVLGVGTFAALTRPKTLYSAPAASGSAEMQGHRGW